MTDPPCPRESAPRSAPPGSCREAYTARVALTGGFDAVARVAMLLRQRRYQVTSLTARPRCESGTGWVLDYVVVLGPEQAHMLVKQLNRLPCVRKVTNRRRCGPHEPGPPPAEPGS